ncbi:DM13 domain-containing protein [Micromonospora sp. B11E3]|uniref:DM13 domain-containing protein n=1 Tax=Micromonospora sp. B11E3 TaxID=3153562 RepID=UPI00325F53B0
MSSALSRRRVVAVVAAVLALGVAAGLMWFKPWTYVTDTEVDEPLSTIATAPSSPATPGASAAPSPTGPSLVSQGEFVSQEFDTSGTARIVRGVDGRYRLELVGLDTTNGPDLRVWLTDQPVRPGPGSRGFDDGRWVEVGRLKGNLGNQAYDIPAGTDLTGLTSVSLWCKRFTISFGAAPLRAAA